MTRENINSRALDAIGYLLASNDVYTKTSIAAELGISSSKLSEILGERMRAGTEILSGLSSHFNISSEWLLTGEGEMIRDTSTQEVEMSPDIVVPTKDKKEGPEMPCTDEFEYVNNDNKGSIPIVHELSFATIDPDEPSTIEADEYYFIKEFRNADFLMRVAGDSMYPKYKPGDLIACRNIRYTNFYQWGKPYALLTCHQGIIIGRVYEHHQYTTFVRVKSDNPSYPEWEIPIDEVARAAIILGSISLD